MKNEKIQIGIVIDVELKKQLRVLAQSDGRAFANYVRKVLADHVEKSKPRRNGLAIVHDKGAVA